MIVLESQWRQQVQLTHYLLVFQTKAIQRFVITEKAPTRAYSWLKAATTAFTFKTLLRHYAKRALTPRSLNVKLGLRRKGHKGRGLVSIVSYSRPSLMIIVQLHRLIDLRHYIGLLQSEGNDCCANTAVLLRGPY